MISYSNGSAATSSGELPPKAEELGRQQAEQLGAATGGSLTSGIGYRFTSNEGAGSSSKSVSSSGWVATLAESPVPARVRSCFLRDFLLDLQRGAIGAQRTVGLMEALDG